MLMNWIHWMAKELFVLFHFPCLPLLLNFDLFFWMSLLIMFFVHFIATASNTVLEEKKKYFFQK